MPRRTRHAPLLCLVAITTTGCGLAEYEHLMAQRLVSLRKEAAFDGLDRPELVSQEHDVWIRLPKHFAGVLGFSRVRDPAAEAAKAKPKPKEGEQPADEPTPEEEAESRGVALPQLLKSLPGFGRVGVRNEQVEKRTLLASYYYLALIEQAKLKPSEVRAEAQKAVRGQWPGLSATWEAVNLETADGKTLPAHRMLADGKMPFDRYESLNPNAPSYSGVLALYCVEAPPYTVLWGVRMPDQVNEQIGLARLAQAAAGTIELRETAESTQNDAVEGEAQKPGAP
jgi:hypothetical protein